jgi:NAD(P)-dependent dehydrogenase (short-subunit alcohol dehydrogenase family)
LQCSLTDSFPHNGDVSVVTGASQGIGQEVAIQLAKSGSNVVMVARDALRLFEAVERVRLASGSARLLPMLADFSQMTEVRRLGYEISTRFPKIALLIHCAAVIVKQRQVTREGFEATFATNTMAPFLLTHLLFNGLYNGAPSRVLFLYGGARGLFDSNNLMSEHNYDGWNAYSQSMNANVMVTLELACRWGSVGIKVNSVFPGFVDTALARQAPMLVRFLLRPFLRTPLEGAVTPIWVATEPDLADVSGKLFGSLAGEPRREAKLPSITCNRDHRIRLFSLLLEWTGLYRAQNAYAV